MALNLDELTKGLATKSEKIRTLGRAGVPTSEIARHLGIRYQHARNVLVDAGLYGTQAELKSSRSAERQPSADSAPSRSTHWTKIDELGALSIDASLLRKVGLGPGMAVFVGMTEDGLELLSESAALVRAQKIAAPYLKPGVSEVDRFIAERRRDWSEE